MKKGKIVTEGDYDKILEKLQKGETVYLENSFEDYAMKVTSSGYFMKRKGGLEYAISPSSKLAIDTLFEANEITPYAYSVY